MKSNIPISKIRKAAKSILPKNTRFAVRTFKSTVPGKRIVRVITEAWPRTQLRIRISRMLKAVETIPAQELKGVLRFSVVTPTELKTYLTGPFTPTW